MSEGPVKRHIRALHRRRDHLAERTKNDTRSDLHFDKAELAALDWALHILDGKVEHKRTRLVRYPVDVRRTAHQPTGEQE